MFTLAPESAEFTCPVFPVLLCSAQKLFLLLSFSAISQYVLYCYFYLYFPQFIQEMLLLSCQRFRGVSNQDQDTKSCGSGYNVVFITLKRGYAG